MSDNRLDRDLIADTSMCNMLMRVSHDRVDVMVYSVVADNELIYRSYALPGHVDWQKELEDVVYENPLLLSDFRKSYILVETKDYMLVPEGLSEKEAKDCFRELHPGYEGVVEIASTSTRNATLVYGLEKNMSGFFHRTFPQAEVMPHISSLLRYFASRSGHGNSRRMICNFRATSMDTIVLDGNKLLHANTFDVKSVADAVYYILAVRMSNGLDPYTDELLLAGDRQMREESTPMLRTYVARVMPVIFPPQMFRAGKESMKAPFDLTVTPLCV